MGTYFFTHVIATDTWHLAYRPEEAFPGGQPENESWFSDGELVPGESWTALVSPYAVDSNSGIGLVFLLASGEQLSFLAHPAPPANNANEYFMTFPGHQVTLRAQCEDGTLTLDWSENELDWTAVITLALESPVSEVGLLLRYDDPSIPASGQAGFARLLDGVWDPGSMSYVDLGEPEDVVIPTPMFFASVMSTGEPFVHVAVGAQFGDLEFDVGKSVRWLTWFSDNVFVLDVNLGTQRYWVVNWAETFPDAEHYVTGVNFFADPVAFRKEQWFRFQRAFGVPSDDDWVLFVDAHEGFSVDNRSLPDDFDIAPFQSFLWREITRAQDLGEKSVVFPLYAFLRSGNITNVTYETNANDPTSTVPPVLQALSVPYYEPYQGLRRLWQASELKQPGFDWSQLDVWATPSAGVKCQIISYAYAHWNLQDIEPPETTVPPLTEANDDGWRMRQLINRVRAVPTIPVGTTWLDPSTDPVGKAGPWAPADSNNPDALDPDTRLPMAQPAGPAAGLEGIITPLYDTVFRLNMRDGVWYEEGRSGNIPLRWDEDAQDWVTDYDPDHWAQQGVKAFQA